MKKHFFGLIAFTVLVLSFSLNSENANDTTYIKPLPSLVITFDPSAFADAYSYSVFNQIYDRMFDYNEFHELTPKLVKEWKVSADGLLYTFKLNNGIFFHDGKRLTSYDVSFTLTRLTGKEAAIYPIFSIIDGSKEYALGYKKSVSGIKIVDDQTIQITLSKPYPLFPVLLASPWASILPDNFEGKSTLAFFQEPIGTGPFVFDKKTTDLDSKIVLKSNDKYFLGKPRISSLLFEKANTDTALTKFNSNYYMDLEEYDIDTKEIKTDYSVIKSPVSVIDVVVYNQRRAPFNNVNFRKALNSAIDKQKLMDYCFKGNMPAKGYIPPGLGGYDNKLPDYEYNVEKAMKYLKAAKLSAEQLRATYNIIRPDNRTCKTAFKELVEKGLKQIGLNFNVTHVPFSELISKYYTTRNFDVLNISFAADFPEAIFMLNDFRGGSKTNLSGINLSSINNLLDKANIETDKHKRYQIYEDIQKALIEEAVSCNLFYQVKTGIFQNNVKGVYPASMGWQTSMWPVYIEGKKQ